MDWNTKTISQWREAKAKVSGQVPSSSISHSPVKWKKPDEGVLKLNVDAVVKEGASSFLMGLVVWDHNGALIVGQTICETMINSVFEVEAYVVYEGFRWVLGM